MSLIAAPAPGSAPEHRCWHLDGGTEARGSGQLYTLEVLPDLANVADVRNFVDFLQLGERLPDSRLFDLKVALSEAVANAIEHANTKVTVWFWLMKDRVIIEVRNRGDFGQEGGKPRKPGRGFGLKLMVSLADEVAFVGARSGSTRVRLIFQDSLPAPDGDRLGWDDAPEHAEMLD